jgi:DNA-binding MarR family transcriptional regulator
VPTKTPAEPLSEAEVAARLRVSATRLARRLRKESTGGLSPSQISALVAVSTHGPLTLGALADHERVAPPTITKVVAKLEADGLLVREADPADRRVSRVSTTAAAEALLAENRQRKTAWLTTRIHQLSPEEQARLSAALDVLDHLIALDPE